MPTILEIQNQILTKAQEQNELSGLDSTSNVAIYRLWAYVVAFVIWLQYEFFTGFKGDVNQLIREQKQYSLLWFREKALLYRHGEDLPEYSDVYENDPGDETDTPVKQAAVIELELQNRKHLFIKVASEVDNAFVEVSEAVKLGLEQYFGRIKPAGTKIIIFTAPADELKLVIRFFYNPLLLDSSGSRIDGTDDVPVQNAIRNFIKNLPFNGEFRLSALVDGLQNLDGCSNRELYIDEASIRYGTLAEFQEISSGYVANAGYMEITEENLNIEFIPKNVQI